MEVGVEGGREIEKRNLRVNKSSIVTVAWAIAVSKSILVVWGVVGELVTSQWEW